MCNSFKARASVEEIARWFGRKDPAVRLRFPAGAPNLEPRDLVRITDTAAIIQPGADGYDLLSRKWSWPGPTGKPVYNFRSEGRRIADRCIIPVDAFYEYTEPQPGERLKTRWSFTMAGQERFCIAGIVRGDAWAMLTVEPGPDVAPYHNRQVVALDDEGGRAWLDGAPEAEVLRPSPAGTLMASRA